jgi:type III secretion protein D
VRLQGSSASAEFTLEADQVHWQVHSGLLLLGGQPLPTGQARSAPLLTPVWLDGTPLAVGPLAAAGWQALFEPAATAAATSPAKTASPAPSPRPRWARRLVMAGAGLSLASLSMLALALVLAPPPASLQQQAQRAQALLQTAGLADLRVSVEDGRLVVDGQLQTDAERIRAEQLLAAQGLSPVLRAGVGQTMVQAVHDVYRVNGIAAEVQAIAPGVVRVRTALADATPLAAVEQTVRRDVRGLTRLDIVNEPPAPVPSAVPALADPGKRVAAVVAGAEPYVATVDGTRYFIGALLPTGHRILAIEGSRVQLEREGQASALVF